MSSTPTAPSQLSSESGVYTQVPVPQKENDDVVDLTQANASSPASTVDVAEYEHQQFLANIFPDPADRSPKNNTSDE
ncbi:hypothetical protein BGX27_007247, partial [Mortierella sp. AM989]